jgi:hypothetical protein
VENQPWSMSLLLGVRSRPIEGRTAKHGALLSVEGEVPDQASVVASFPHELT